jgi:cobalamin-dependent methionine synthase I
MLIVGESINSSRKEINSAVGERDAAFIKELAQKQVDAGAHYLDVNCGTKVFNEPETMVWLVETILEQVQIPLCIDSPNPKAIAAVLPSLKHCQPMINSITAEKKRFQDILPLVLEYGTKIVALCMDDSGMPETASDRLKVAEGLVKELTAAGVKQEDIYLDPLVKPVSTSDKAGIEVLETIRNIKQMFPEVHLICGLSNVSYGLPNRQVLNQTFMIQTMTMGMDSYILDVLDKRLMGYIYASQALLGKDEYCMNYLTAYRSGLYN